MLMIRNTVAAISVTLLFLMSICNGSGNKNRLVSVEPYISDSGSVVFDIAPVGDRDGVSQWAATYTSSGKTAKFRIEFSREKTPEAKDSEGFNFSSGEGRFIAEPGSDSAVLIADLKKALEASVVPTKIQKTGSVPFTFVTIGDHLSQAEGGGFNTKPAGNWKAMKLFMGEGEQEAELFLNLNPVSGKGQFSIKDPEYGNLIIAELVKVL